MQLLKRYSWVFGLDSLSRDVASRLVDALYAQNTTLMFGAVMLAMSSIVGFVLTHSLLMLAWGASIVPLTLWRVRISQAYQTAGPDKNLYLWCFLYLIGAWLTGALWGAASFIILIPGHPEVKFLLIVCQTAFIAGGVVRNSPITMIAEGQAYLTLTPLLVISLATGDAFYIVFAGFTLVHILASRMIVRIVHQQTLGVFLASAENSILAAKIAETNRQLESSNRHLEKMVTTDALTAVLNRRGFDIRLLQEWQKAIRDNKPLSLMMIDVDQFKLFNDRYGHQTGDDGLRQIASGIVSGTRAGDITARYGGEEFTVILSDTDSGAASIVAERVRAAVEALDIPHMSSQFGHVTVSVGFATRRPASADDDPAVLVKEADRALYQAKHEGRNRVYPYTPAVEPPSPVILQERRAGGQGLGTS